MPHQAESYTYSLLSEDNLKLHVLPQFGLENGDISQIKFKDSEKQRAVYKIDCDGQSYCLKKVYFQVPDLLFVYSAIEWLFRNGINVPRILPTKSQGRFVEYSNMFFILTPWIDGIKCSYDNPQHVLDASSTLSNMHRCTRHFIPVRGSTARNGFEDISGSLQKHFQQLLNCSNLAFKYKDRFSKIFLQSFDTNIILAQTALNIASTIHTDNLSKTLCHLDYVNKNIIFDNENRLWVIDFDKCKMDYCVHDIAYFLRRILKRDNTKWDLQLAMESLKLYEDIHPLSLDEYKYLIVYLSFPQKYWKISRDYYNNINKCNKSSFITLLNKSTDKNDYQMQFIQEFKVYIEDKFNTRID
jgi:CotS family spore coat protein